MFPFSVLRIWGLGLFSWLVLGLGIYLIWEALRDHPEDHPVLDRSHAMAPVEHPDRPRRDDPGREQDTARETAPTTTIQRQETVETSTNDTPERRRWYLAAGITLMALSFGGWLPGSLMAMAVPAEKDETPFETVTVSRPDGSQLHVEVTDNPGRPTIVFTHGWSLNRTAWRYARSQFAKNFRVVVWDLAGLGDSKAPTNSDFSVDKMARDLDAVINATSAKEQVFLMGHSIGGMITQTYCRLFPHQVGKRVLGIVLLHTTYTDPCQTVLGSSVIRALEYPVLVPLNHLTAWLAPLAWLSNWQSYFNGSLHMTTRLTSFAGGESWAQLDHGAWLAAIAWPGVVARGNLGMTQFDEQRSLPQVDIPALVISGNHDRLTKPVASDRLESLLPRGLRGSLNGGHLGFWEANGGFVELVTQFVDQHAVHHAPGKPHIGPVPSNSTRS